MLYAAPPRPHLPGSALLWDDPAFLWAPERSGFALPSVFVPIKQDKPPEPPQIVALSVPSTEAAIGTPWGLEPIPIPLGPPPAAPYLPDLAPPPAAPSPPAPPLDLLVQPPAAPLPLTITPTGPAALDLALLDALLAAAPLPAGVLAVPPAPPPPHLAWLML